MTAVMEGESGGDGGPGAVVKHTLSLHSLVCSERKREGERRREGGEGEAQCSGEEEREAGKGQGVSVKERE